MERDEFIVRVVKNHILDSRRKALNARLKLVRARKEGRPANVMSRLESAAHVATTELDRARRWMLDYDLATKPVVSKAEITTLLDEFD